MKTLIIPLLIVLATGLPISPAHADDAKEQVRQAVKALVTAPTYRMVATYTDLHTKKSAIVTLECVKPDQAALRYEQDGHITKEFIAVGNKVYLRQGTDGRFKAFPGSVVELVSRMQSEALQTYQAFGGVTLIGHRILNGEPASMYKLGGSVDGAHSNMQIWISDKSHLPVKSDAVASVPDPSSHGHVVRQHVVSTYTYDTSLKITAPNR